MIIPSIDLMDGRAVQLVGGKEKKLDAGDPLPLAEQFGVVGEIAVIDLDAAMGRGSNEETIKRLLRVAPCRVGGGIRDLETAIKWLDAGAAKVILGTKAVPEILEKLPRDRVIAALDAVHDDVVVEGWQKSTGTDLFARMAALRELVGGFLVTAVEREGRMVGVDLERIRRLIEAAGSARLTYAGGIAEASEIGSIDALGADSQVGMALYTGALDLGGSVAAALKTDRPDGLWPTMVADEHGVALGLAYSSAESLKEAIASRRGVYCSRKRGVWKKGETSGAQQELLKVEVDCDRDTLLFTVRQYGAGFCHQSTYSCFGQRGGLFDLERIITARLHDAPDGSYTKRLFQDPKLLENKLTEELGELIGAGTPEEITAEAADLTYFLTVKLAAAGVKWEQVEKDLDFKKRKVVRRPGNAKPTKE